MIFSRARVRAVYITASMEQGSAGSSCGGNDSSRNWARPGVAEFGLAWAVASRSRLARL